MAQGIVTCQTLCGLAETFPTALTAWLVAAYWRDRPNGKGCQREGQLCLVWDLGEGCQATPLEAWLQTTSFQVSKWLTVCHSGSTGNHLPGSPASRLRAIVRMPVATEILGECTTSVTPLPDPPRSPPS